MRFFSITLLAGVAAFASAQSMPLDDDKRPGTTFDDIRVPPLLELSPKNIEEEMNKTKFIMIKHYRSDHSHTCVRVQKQTC